MIGGRRFLGATRGSQGEVLHEMSTLGEFAELLDRGAVQPDLISLDVFDTVITRACGRPSDVFLWLGRRLRRQGVIECDATVFAEARARAERAVWHREGHLDSRARLTDFCAETAARLGLDVELVSTLRDAELDLECSVSRPVPAAARLLARTSDQHLVFTSDTYFDREFVEALLRRAGCFRPSSVCFVSSETDVSKAGGGLFDALRLPGSDARVVHLGDDPRSDVEVARRRGIDARQVHEGRLNRYELLLARDAAATSGFSSALAGASRLARMATDVASEHEAAIRRVAAGVAAPALVGYVLWTIRRAEQLGLRRLVFLARDGQVMADIARTLVARLGAELEVRYLLVSRRSTNLAGTFELNDEEIGWVFRDLHAMTVREALSRFDLSWADVDDHLDDLSDARPDQSAASFGPALRDLLAVEPVRDLVLRRAAARRRLVLDYFAQEGLLDDRRSGVIDFGGVGSQVRSVHSLIAAGGSPAPRVFMVGLDDPDKAGVHRPADEPAWLRDTECYLHDHYRRRGARRDRGFATAFQVFCAADHGSIEGYERDGGSVQPILAVDVDEQVVEWGLPIVRSTVDAFVDALTLDVDLVDPYADVRDVCCSAIDLFWSTPESDEAAAWGAFALEGAEAGNARSVQLAHPYSWRQVGADLVGGRFPDLGWQHWYEGSLELSPRALRRAVKLARGVYRRSGGRVATTIATIAQKSTRR